MTNPEFRFLIQPLEKFHDRAAFLCGDGALDNYFAKVAGQDAKSKASAVFVLVEKNNFERVVGFYTLSSAIILAETLPRDLARKLPKYPNLPATLLGRLAVSKDFQGQNLGEILLVDALKRSFLQSHQIGSIAVTVDAKNERARLFYEKHDFIRFIDQPFRLFIPMKKIETWF